MFVAQVPQPPRPCCLGDSRNYSPGKVAPPTLFETMTPSLKKCAKSPLGRFIGVVLWYCCLWDFYSLICLNYHALCDVVQQFRDIKKNNFIFNFIVYASTWCNPATQHLIQQQAQRLERSQPLGVPCLKYDKGGGNQDVK